MMVSNATIQMDATGDNKLLNSVSVPRATDFLEKKLLDVDSAILTTATSEDPPHASYLDELLEEKARLKRPDGQFKHVVRLIDVEISRLLQESDANYDQPDKLKRVTLVEKLMVPVDKYPGYNFVGRILGPRGMTARQLEEETGCKILVRGRGNQAHMEPLHIVIQCDDFMEAATAKMKNAIEKVNALLNPPPEGKDELKRKQLIELSIINGTYRPTTATKNTPQLSRPLMMPFAGTASPNLVPFSPMKLANMSPEKHNSAGFDQFQQMMPQHQYVDSFTGHRDSGSMLNEILGRNYNNSLLAAISSIFSSPPPSQVRAGQSYSNTKPFVKNH